MEVLNRHWNLNIKILGITKSEEQNVEDISGSTCSFGTSLSPKSKLPGVVICCVEYLSLSSSSTPKYSSSSPESSLLVKISPSRWTSLPFFEGALSSSFSLQCWNCGGVTFLWMKSGEKIHAIVKVLHKLYQFFLIISNFIFLLLISEIERKEQKIHIKKTINQK